MLLSQVFDSPKSIVFDPETGQYFISNASDNKTGGSIVSMDPLTHDVSEFVSEGVNSPKGMILLDGILYCNDINTVRGFDLESREQVFEVTVPKAKFLSDICFDGKMFYVSDLWGDAVFSIDRGSSKAELFMRQGGLDHPNGLLFDAAKNRLLISSYVANANIQAIDLINNKLYVVSQSPLNHLDGMVFDKDGNCYVSSLSEDVVYKFAPDFKGQPEVFSNWHFGPADIYFNKHAEMLAIPNFRGNKIDFVELDNKTIEDQMNPYRISLFPNPSSNAFFISYELDKPKEVSVFVMNKSGRVMHEISEKEVDVGTHQFSFETQELDLRKGVYFIKIVIGESVFMKRIAILE